MNLRLATKDIIIVKETPTYHTNSNSKILIYLPTNTTIIFDTQTTHKDSSIPMVIKLKHTKHCHPREGKHQNAEQNHHKQGYLNYQRTNEPNYKSQR